MPRGSTWYCSISGTVPQRHRNFCTRGQSVGDGEGEEREQGHGLPRKSGLTGPLTTDAGHAQAPGITSQEQQGSLSWWEGLEPFGGGGKWSKV